MYVAVRSMHIYNALVNVVRVQWCAMHIFHFLRFYNFIQGIMCIYIVFLKKSRPMFLNLFSCSIIYYF